MRAQLLSAYLFLCAASVASASSLWTRTGSNNVTSSNSKPVLAVNFPDPALVESGGAWYAFATSGNGKNVQAAVSGDFLNPAWRLLQDADVLPDPGAWAVNDQNIWAPGVTQLVSRSLVVTFGTNSQSRTIRDGSCTLPRHQNQIVVAIVSVLGLRLTFLVLTNLSMSLLRVRLIKAEP